MYITAVSHSIVTVLYVGFFSTRQHCLITPEKREKDATARDTSLRHPTQLDYGVCIGA